MKRQRMFKIMFYSVLVFFAYTQTACRAQILDLMKGEEERLEKQAAIQVKEKSEDYDKSIEEEVKRAQQSLDYTSFKLRDPFMLTVPQEAILAQPKEATPLPQFKIQGFIWGSSLPQAIIDGKVYGVGDVVDGAQIIQINKEGITFLYQGNTYIVR